MMLFTSKQAEDLYSGRAVQFNLHLCDENVLHIHINLWDFCRLIFIYKPFYLKWMTWYFDSVVYSLYGRNWGTAKSDHGKFYIFN